MGISLVLAFRRNVQPSPQVAISGVWGHVTNKHLAGSPGTDFLLNTQSYGRLHCLPFCGTPEKVLAPRNDIDKLKERRYNKDVARNI